MRLLTVLYCAGSKDKELRGYAIKELSAKYGAAATGLIVSILVEITSLEEAVPVLELIVTMDQINELFSGVKQLVGEKDKIEMKCIADMCRTGNDFYKRKALELNIAKNGTFINYILNRYFFSFASSYHDEFYQCGVIGLINAIYTYEASAGNFLTHCRPYIMHEMTKQVMFLKCTGTLHYNKLQKRVSQAENELRKKNVEITPEKIAELTGFSISIVEREMEIMEKCQFIYLDEVQDREEMMKGNFCASPEQELEIKEEQSILKEALDRLSEEHRMIIILHEIESFSFVKIANIMGMKVGRIQYQYKKAIQELREILRYMRYFS